MTDVQYRSADDVGGEVQVYAERAWLAACQVQCGDWDECRRRQRVGTLTSWCHVALSADFGTNDCIRCVFQCTRVAFIVLCVFTPLLLIVSMDQPHGTICHQHYGHRTCRRAPSSGHWSTGQPVLDRSAPLRHLHDSGTRYKYPDLLTYVVSSKSFLSLKVVNIWALPCDGRRNCRIGPVHLVDGWCKKRPEPCFSLVRRGFAYVTSFHQLLSRFLCCHLDVV